MSETTPSDMTGALLHDTDAGVSEPAPAQWTAPRILLDQSGYHLLNLGDVAMLQAAVTRLRACWPHATIEVICHAPERLRQYCPDAGVVDWLSDGDPTDGRPRARLRAALVQIYKIVAPYLWARGPWLRRRMPSWIAGHGLLTALERADLVVAAGGGYVNDAFWWHGSGVLSVLHLAQALGKPTAMFGQGIGPLRQPLLRRQAAHVLRRVDVIGLREGATGRGELRSLKVADERVVVTGDDALELAAQDGPRGHSIGVNVRVAGYSNVGQVSAREIGRRVLAFARSEHTDIVALPVSRYPRDSDLEAVRRMFAADATRQDHIELRDIETTEGLVAAVARCRIVVTGSYHAATFACALGLSCVCVTGSTYYDQKFRGLADLFSGIRIVSSDGPSFGADLAVALSEAWNDDEEVFLANRRAAREQLAVGRQAFGRFKHIAEGRSHAGAPG